MEQLATSYVKYGFQFDLVQREGLAAIFSQRDSETNALLAYEVFEVQQLPDQYVGPNRYFKSARETPPNTESWGQKGWTCHGLEQAKVKFEELKSRLLLREENRTEKALSLEPVSKPSSKVKSKSKK